MNPLTLFLLLVSMAVGSSQITVCTDPSLFAPEFPIGQGANVCASPNALFQIIYMGPDGQYMLRGGSFPNATGACAVPTGQRKNALQVFPSSGPSAGSAELSFASNNFTLYYTSGAILPITSSTVEAAEGTMNVKMTWLHTSSRQNLTLVHYSPDGQVRRFIMTSFGKISNDQYTVDLESACVLRQELATRSVTINILTMSLGGTYSVIYSNETTDFVIGNITVVVLPAATPSVTPSLTTSNTISTSSDTPNAGSTHLTTSPTPTIGTVPAAPLAAIIAVLLVIVPVAIAVLFSTIIIVGCFVYKRRKKGRADITPADDRSPRPIHRQTSIGRKGSNASVSSQTVLMQSRAGSVSTRSGSFSTPGTPSKPDYTGVYATSGFTHIKAKMLGKYKDQVRDLKNKEEIIAAVLDQPCKEIIAFAGSNGNTDWEEIFKEIESRSFPIEPPKITRVIFSDSDPAEGQCVETGRVKFVHVVGKPDEPDILEKLMMKGDLPVLKKDSHQRYPSSDATQISRDEPDYRTPIDEEEHTPQTPSESPAVTHVKSEINLSGSTNSTPSPVKKDRHPTAATSMQLTTATHKKVEQLRTPTTGLQSTSAPLINTARVENLLVESIELHKKELSTLENIERYAKITADKTGEQVELYLESTVSSTAQQDSGIP